MSPASPPASSRTRIDSSLLWIFVYFLGGLLVVIGLRVFFNGLETELNERNANEQARLSIGEEIIRGIHGVEKDLYKMAVTTNPAGVRMVQRDVEQKLSKLQQDLLVLKEGGTVRREVFLNLEGRDLMQKEFHYQPAAETQGYVMELIEIAPLLDQVQPRAVQLAALLERRWEALESGNERHLIAIEDEIATFLKHLAPLFGRLDENASRLFHDSNEQLQALEAQLSLQRQRLVWVEGGLVALVVALAVVAGIIVMRRIHRANLAREQALTEARQARDEAERASQAKSEFVSRMSHELRTPLNAILGFAQLLEGEPMSGTQKHYVGLINSSGNHLMELINAVLDHAKIEAGSLVLERIGFDFPASIEAVRSIVAARATDKGLRFVASIAPDLPRHVRGDPTRLRQVLINLLINAVKFTETGTVELQVRREGQAILFSVRDTGIGMDELTLARLFQPFAQADESITRKYGGTGLGLLISRELVEAMGGSIEVESCLGSGSCFRVRLPLEEAEPPVQAPAGPAADAGRIPDSPARRLSGTVLLVDDNRINQQLGVAMLGRLQLEHDLADNGRRCLERLAQKDYALVLMDVEMPEMDGITATRQIREQEAREGRGRLPIIAMTANALSEDRARCLAAGMDGYIAKPISLQALENEIGRILGSAAPAPEPLAGGAPLPGTSPGPDALPPYDREQGVALIGDAELFQQLTELYVADLPNYLHQLDESLAGEDWPVLSRSAHTLKGLFGTFVAAGAEADARRLEHAAAQGDAQACRELTPLVRAHAIRLGEAFAAHGSN